MEIAKIAKAAGQTAVDLVKSENVQNKFTGFMGMLMPYFGLEKKALDMYISDIEKSDLSKESKLIAILQAKKTIKRLKNQKDIVEIAVKNAKEDTDFTEKSGVDLEWFDRFMESAGLVTSDNIKLIWGKVLAGEFENAGSTPLNMTRILTEITPAYAEAFSKICGMQRKTVVIDENENVIVNRDDIVVPIRGNEKALSKIGLSINMVNELETLGLIKFDALSGYVAIDITGKAIIWYPEGVSHVISKHDADKLPIGNVTLTAAGECLRRIIEPIPYDGYAKLVDDFSIRNGVEYMAVPDYEIVQNGSDLILHKTSVSNISITPSATGTHE